MGYSPWGCKEADRTEHMHILRHELTPSYRDSEAGVPCHQSRVTLESDAVKRLVSFPGPDLVGNLLRKALTDPFPGDDKGFDSPSWSNICRTLKTRKRNARGAGCLS